MISDNDMISNNDTKYGFGKNPPYSLYQADNGKWGLIDGSGAKLEAVFKRGEKDCFSRVPWEVVTFNPQDGFELLAWYDPDEVWFNFTFDDPAYPADYAVYLWENRKNDINAYSELLYELIPNENHWLIDEILQEDALMKKDDEDFYEAIDSKLICHPELAEPAVTNRMLEPVMKSPEIDMDIKIALWQTKVRLDSHIRTYKEEYPAGM